jgi:hypothetical protein
MADNIAITQGSGTTIATEDVSSVQHQKVKIEFGGDGVATMVSASDPLPVSATIDTTGLATDATDTNTATIAGAVSGTEMQVDVVTMPPITIDTTGLATDATDASVASIDSKTPALGQALAAASVPVVLTASQLTTLTPPAAITGFATSAKQDTIIGHVDGIEGLLTTIDSDTGIIATEVAGLLTDTELRATPVPVSATDLDIRPLVNTDVVTAELSAVDNAALDDIASKLGTIDDSNGVASGTALNASTAPVTVIGMRNSAGNAFYAAGASDNADNLAVNANGNDLKTASLGFVFDGTAWDRTPGTSTDGMLVNLGTNNDVSVTGTVDLGATDNAVLDTIAAKDFATQTTLSAMNAKLVSGTDIGDVTINNTTSNAVPVQPPLSGYLNVSIDQTGNNNAVDVLTIAAGNNNIGDVDVASIAAGDNNIGNVDIVSGTVTTVTTLTGGGVAHDSPDSGNPNKIGFKAYSPDGTTPGTAVAEADRTDAKGDLDGRLFINDEHPRYWSYHLNTSTAQTDTSVAADPGDGFQLVITDIQFSNGAATAINMFLEEGASTIWGPVYLEAINGRGYVWKGKKHVTASTALTITTSSSTAHSVEILGYIQAV